MSDNGIGRFAKHSAIYAIGNIANRAGAFLLLPLYTRHMTVTQYGALELFYVTSSVISSFLSIGIAHAALRYFFEYKEPAEQNKVMPTCILSTLMYTVPVLLVLSIWNVPLAKFVFSDVSYAPDFKLVYAILILELVRQIGLSYMRAREYSVRFVVVCLLQLVLQVGCNVYTVGIRQMGVTGVLTGNLISIFAGTVYTSFVVFKECGVHFDKNKMKEIVRYSSPFLFTAVISVLLSNLDKIMLRMYFSLGAVGIYALAMKFSALLGDLFLEPFNRSFGAYRFSIMHNSNVKETLVKIYTYVMVGVFFMTLGISVYSKEIIKLMTDPPFWPAYLLVPFLTLSGALGASNYMFQTGMLYTKKTKYMIHTSTASAALNVGLYFLLIPRFGMNGAVATMLVKGVIDTALMYFVAQRLYPIPYDLRTVFKMLGITLSFILFAIWLPHMHVFFSLSVMTLLVLAFPMALYLTGCITHSDVGRILDFLREQRAKLNSLLPSRS